jgi:hypothetical protein
VRILNHKAFYDEQVAALTREWNSIADHGHCQALFVDCSNTKHSCEIKLQGEGLLFWVLVDGIAAQDRHGPQRICRAAAIDITQQKHADESATANWELQAACGEIDIMESYTDAVLANFAYSLDGIGLDPRRCQGH